MANSFDSEPVGPAPEPIGEIVRRYDDGQPVGSGREIDDWDVTVVYPSGDPENDGAAAEKARRRLAEIFGRLAMCDNQ